MTGWVFFRLEAFDDSVQYISKMFSFKGMFTELHPLTAEVKTIFTLALLFAFFTLTKKGQRIQDWFYARSHGIKAYLFLSIVSILLFSLSLASITGTGFNPFIYFRF